MEVDQSTSDRFRGNTDNSTTGAPIRMKLIFIVLVPLITHLADRVLCADYSEQEIPNDVKKCPNGYCVKLHQCINGTINYDGTNMIAARLGDDFIEIRLDDQNDPCEQFMMRCCASNSKRDLLPMSTEPNSATDLPPPICGTNYPNGYIVQVRNDSIAQFAEIPWMASLLQRKTLLGKETLEFFCGGSLIHPKVVLTAAHCMSERTQLAELVVRLGEWDTVTKNEPIEHQEHTVSKIIIHENFRNFKFHNDLALLILDAEAVLDMHINPICLPNADDNFDGMRCMVSGWGAENFNPEGKYSEVLKKVELPVVPREECQRKFTSTKLGPDFRLHPSFLCAGGEPGVDVCKGDGGSPLVCKNGDRFVQAGIVSWGVGCGDDGVPGAYAKVSNFVPWIETTLMREGIEL